MILEIQRKVAESFSLKYAETELNIDLSESEFNLLNKGIFATNMEGKWNIFIVDSSVYFVRSWSYNCIFKVDFEKNNRKTILRNLKITRDQLQYKSTDINYDKTEFKNSKMNIIERRKSQWLTLHKNNAMFIGYLVNFVFRKLLIFKLKNSRKQFHWLRGRKATPIHC